MKTIEFNVQEPYKSFLLSGKKKIEGRLNKGKFKDLETGDVLLFSTGEKFEIQKLKYYDSFRQMLEMGGTENIIPNANTLEEGLQVYYQFYTQEQEKKFGVIGIYLRGI